MNTGKCICNTESSRERFILHPPR